MKDKPLVNRVANSGLITINLEDFFPKEEIVLFDLKDYLFRGLILREKDFRTALKEMDWTAYEGKNIALYCSTDAIIPIWAYQLVIIHASPYAKKIVQGDAATFIMLHYYDSFAQMDFSKYTDERVILKGCGEKPVPVAAYTEFTRKLQPFAKKIMYGEACSMVPLYKKAK